MSKIIVFGGSGFIGSHVADVLAERGHVVSLFDARPSPFLKENQEMIVGDILDSEKVQDSVHGCDYIYHFAGIADLDTASVKPLETVTKNINGTAIILDAAHQAKIKRFVFASTIYVYSDKGGFYRCSKQAAELYIEEYQRQFGLDYTVLRYGTVYGPRSDERNSVYRYLLQALTENRIICKGTGEELREYIHVVNAANLSVDILSDEYRNEHIIITGHHPIRFKDMLQTIREILGDKVEIKFDFQEDKKNNRHYGITPYSFIPKTGKKLVTNYYVDLGQGLLECLHEINIKVKGEG